MSQLLACAVFEKKAGVRFFDGPGRREAAAKRRSSASRPELLLTVAWKF
jgi:hypothetical protein